MREATKEERELVNSYIESISQKAIIIPDGATNGDMIKALFPNTRVQEGEYYTIWNVGTDSVSFWNSWWNAPYKKEGE